ncbi:indolepyruvate ferredoxin oxidoreductase [Methanobrevibacter cuticularis]|uniref:Indolepyruvate ferredoxin oxidoreductase n=1 Tax=Methanobrevibacter cuticularis TaxID=47311 RepID=A0A166CU93_9EURY|nr:thiamine pyrophosphate-dependent enzyme [Methanobrevibacter cuticularis]KZX16857.1 indolepyruvate ferredoxin oxidoreductase [Methanobrevibacter cuticularis]
MELNRLVKGKKGEKQFLLGNEAAVRGTIEAGVSIASTYPGTPSSEIGNILSVLAKDAKMYFEFSINEKVAMEVAAASAASGIRSFTFMKHVGLNVASDSFVSVVYTGIHGGMVILSADDPSMFSSQNEQDNRHYGRLANLPVLEPSNPQEVKDMIKHAYNLSEDYKIPVLIRTTTRVSHMRGIVEFGDIPETVNLNEKINSTKDNHWKKGFFKKDPKRFVPVPDNALDMHKNLVSKMKHIDKIANNSDLNVVFNFSDKHNETKATEANNKNSEVINENSEANNENSEVINENSEANNKNSEVINENTKNNDKITEINKKNTENKTNNKKFGAIASGSGFNYVYDVINEDNLGIDILKLGFTYPFPKELVVDFVKDLDGVFIIEEVDPIMEKEVLATFGENQINIPVFGKIDGTFPLIYEFNPDIVRDSIDKVLNHISSENKVHKTGNVSVKLDGKLTDLFENLPSRPPTLCAGCSHRSTYFGVRRAAEELGIANEDLIFSSDIGCYTLGVSPPYETTDYLLSMGSSIGDACGFSKATNQKIVSFIGDSTFFHGGIPPLINGVHNNHRFVVTILDNRTTAMTGGQPNPGLPVDGMGDVAPEISIEKIAIAAGCEFVETINPINLMKTVDTYKRALEYDGIAVIIAKHPCTLIKGLKKRRSMIIKQDKCNKCLDCITTLACPAISLEINKESKEKKVIIDDTICKGCTTCLQMCKNKAIGIKKD